MPFEQFDMYNHSVQQIGNSGWFEGVQVIGDPEKMDFLAFYYRGEIVYRVVGTNKRGEVQVMNEAMKLGLLPHVSDIRMHQTDIVEVIDKRIRVSFGLQ